MLERSADGDTAAFAAVYDATASQALGLSIRLLGDRTLAEDSVQEAYLSIWRKAASFDSRKGSSASWIHMIVHHTAVNHIRSAQARSDRDRRHSREDLALHGSNEDPTHDLACASIDARTVRAALVALSVQHRQALELSFLSGYTHREVAELLGIPYGTAKTRIRDARIRLRASAAIQAVRDAPIVRQDAGAYMPTI